MLLLLIVPIELMGVPVQQLWAMGTLIGQPADYSQQATEKEPSVYFSGVFQVLIVQKKMAQYPCQVYENNGKGLPGGE